MILKDELLKKLRSAFDLNIYEVKIWTALLCRGVATAGELSDISQIPRSRSYDVLDSLEKKGFVMMKLGKPIKYMAIEPQEIVTRIKDRVQKKSNDRMKELDNVKKETLFGDLELLYKQGIQKVDPTNLSGSVKGRDALYSQLKTMLENAEKEVIIATTADGATRKIKKFKNLFTKLHTKGVTVKMLAPTKDIDQNTLKLVKGSVTLKEAEAFDARFCLVDRKEALFMISNDKDVHETYDSAVWISTPFFSQAFGTMFDTVWKGGKK